MAISTEDTIKLLDALTPLIAAIAWPVTALLLVGVFYKRISAFISRITASLSVSAIKLKVFGSEVELTPEQVKSTLDELLKDILETTNDLQADEVETFRTIRSAEGSRTVIELFPDFVRDGERHKKLGKLRGRKLIRPFEGSRWQSYKHPVVTRFSEIVCKLRPEICEARQK